MGTQNKSTIEIQKRRATKNLRLKQRKAKKRIARPTGYKTRWQRLMSGAETFKTKPVVEKKVEVSSESKKE